MSITGTGTQADPYVVTTYDDLHNIFWNIGRTYWSGSTAFYIELANDIDMNDRYWAAMIREGVSPSNYPPAHINLNNHGIYNMRLPASTHVIDEGGNRISGEYLFKCLSIENGTLNMHTDRTQYLLPDVAGRDRTIAYYPLTFKNVKFTGYIDVTQRYNINTGYYYDCILFQSRFYHCVFDNFVVNFSRRTMQTINPYGNRQAVFGCDYIAYGDPIPFQYCDFDLRIHNNTGVGAGGGTPAHIFMITDSGEFHLYRCRIRGIMTDNTASLNNFLLVSSRYVIEDCVVNIDFNGCKIASTSQVQKIIDDNAPNMNHTISNCVVNSDYFRYINLHHKLSGGGLISCTSQEITTGNSLRSKGFPVTNISN